MEEEKLMEDEAKKKKRRDRHRSVWGGGGGSKILALTLKLNQELSQLNQTRLISVNPKKKKMMKFLLECIKDKNSNSKFSSFFQTPNFQFKIFIPKFSTQIFSFQKNSNLIFHDQNSKP